jgi:ABC-type transporter Mla MlaB component
MLRITEKWQEHEGPSLILEGRLVGPWVEVLRASCEQLVRRAPRFTLDLAEINFADAAGLALLYEYQLQQITLVNCPAFLQEQLRQTAYS